MYEIRLDDGANVYYQGDSDYAAYDIECVTQKGDAGYLQFTLPKTNPVWGRLVTRQSVLEFVCDGESIGFFEVREITHDIQFSERVYAVGELAWLYDSIQPQAQFRNVTPKSFLTTLLNVHNAQCPEHQFRVGTVDVVDTNDSIYRFTNRETTLDDIREKLIDRLGGQIRLRRVGSTRYVDYLTDATYGGVSSQRIYFGENLLDYADTLTVDGICSEVIPLGATLESSSGDNSQIGNLEQRLTVESVNGGSDCVSNSSLVARFGHVRSVQTWDDVTIASNLLAKARKWLSDTQFEQMHLTVKAVDLSLTSTQFDKLRVGESVRVIAEPYGLDRQFPITKRTFHPDAPDSDVVELNDEVSMSYIQTQAAAAKAEAVARSELEYNQTQWLVNAIDNANAMLTGSRGGYRASTYNKDGEWQGDVYYDNADHSAAKRLIKVDKGGISVSESGTGGYYQAVNDNSARYGVLLSYDDSKDVLTLYPLSYRTRYINGIAAALSEVSLTRRVVPTRTYVDDIAEELQAGIDAIVPSGAKSYVSTVKYTQPAVRTKNNVNVGLDLTIYERKTTYTGGFYMGATATKGDTFAVPLTSYVESLTNALDTKIGNIVPSGAKSSNYTHYISKAEDYKNASGVLQGMKITPATLVKKYSKGMLIDSQTTNGTTRTLALKSYVDSEISTLSSSVSADIREVDGKVPTFSLSGTTLTIRV